MQKLISVLLLVYVFSYNSNATVWNVGPLRTFTLPSQVKTLVQDGDTVYIDGGVYANDATKWTRNNLWIEGLGTGSNRTVLQYTGDIPNGKGIFVFETPGSSDNPRINNIVFDGAQVSDNDGGNGAGIRFQAANLIVDNCSFINCQNGILEGNASVTNSSVNITNCEFYNNGYQLPNSSLSGYEHNIYIGPSTNSLVVINCWFHHPRGQANSLKTRAQHSYILYNLIDEETDGYGSWELNIAQGGLNVIMGNVIIQGPAGANHGIVGYDAATNALEDFYFINNTVINRFVGNVKYFNVAPASGINTFKIYNNIFASVTGASITNITGTIPTVLDTSANLFSTNYLTLGFTNAMGGDYSLTASATGAIDKGVFADSSSDGMALLPIASYQSFDTGVLSRSVSGSAIDLGAYEYLQPNGITQFTQQNEIAVYPNPASDHLFIETGKSYNEIYIFNLTGTLVSHSILPQDGGMDIGTLSSGVYIAEIKCGDLVVRKKWVKM
jgi:hypothetical protein